MDTSLNIQPATPEIVWAMLRELTEKQAETDKQLKETDRQIKETNRNIDDAWKQIKENNRNTDDSWKQIKETGRNIDDAWKQIRETGRNIDSAWKQIRETDKQIRETNRQLGGMANNQGCFAEEYFFNSFEKGKKNFFGEKFDDIRKNLKGMKTDDEFDIVMLNGQSVGIVEIKYKGHENDVPRVLKKANAFRTNFTEYKNHAIYLGLATMAFYPELEQVCKDNGIAIIKQAGDTVVINDEHLKAF